VAALSETKPGLHRSDAAWSATANVAAHRPVEGSPELLNQLCITDWDNDGRLDLVTVCPRDQGPGTTCISDIVWHRNVAATGEPRLSGPQRLVSLPDTETAVGLSTGDWDRDGWPDLIVGYIRVARGSYEVAGCGVRVYTRSHQRPSDS
jgi:hypothetical protein